MTDTDTFEVGASEDLDNFCSTCMRKSKHFIELKPKRSSLVETLFNNYQISTRIFHVCPLCKLAIDFVSQFERLCEMSRLAAENWDVIDIKAEYFKEDPKVQNALVAICQWATGTLDENLRMYKIEERDYVVASTLERHPSAEREFDEEMLLPVIKSEAEEVIEEYLVDSDYDVGMDDVDEEEAFVLEIKPAKKRSRKKETKSPLFTCDVDICQSKFFAQKSLHIHMEKVHGLSVVKAGKLPIEKVLSCTEMDCDFKASSQLKLNRHLQNVHQLVIKKTFCCDVCGQIYPSKCRLQYHMNCHLNISPFLCDFEGCTRAFRNPTRLRNHKQELHLQVIRMHCAICGKGFRTKASHDLHILGHEKPTIPCEVCGRLLTNRKTLRTHLMTHTGERRYKCEVEGCNKAFTKCSGLQVHMRSHTKEKVILVVYHVIFL